MPKKILIVGAGGFVGGFLVEEALRRGYEVWAGVRESTWRDRLGDPRIHFVVFDYDDAAQVAEALRSAMPEDKWDYVVWNLGATKVVRYTDFNRINYDYLRTFTGALHESGKVPERMVLVSSLSVLGATHDRDGKAYSEEMIPQPNTRYGASKLKAELWMATSGIPYVIIRATGVYGPWDHDYFLMVESIKKGFDFGVGFRKQTLTFIYAADLAKAILDAAERGEEGEVYHITEPRAYTQREFRRIVKKILGKKVVLPVRLPLWMAGVACAVMEKIGVFRGKPATLNRDKYRILRQRNWNCSHEKAERELGFRAETDLATGMGKAIEWYKQNGWIK